MATLPIALFFLLAWSTGLVGAASAAPTASEIFEDLGFTAEEQALARAGELVTTERSESSDRELTVVMAFLVEASADDVSDDFHELADYGADAHVTAHGRIEGEGSLESFAGLSLEPGRAEASALYQRADPEEINVSEAEARALAGLSVGDPAAVEAEIRSLLLARHRAYRGQGLGGIDPYVRGGDDYAPARDLLAALESHGLFDEHAPGFGRTLREYPEIHAEDLRQDFFWVNFEVDGVPTFALTHRLSLDVGGGVHAFVDRHYYVSRSYNVLQIFGGIFPVKEGTLVFYENRTSSHQAAGFGASTKHAVGRKIMGRRIGAIFEKLRGSP